MCVYVLVAAGPDCPVAAGRLRRRPVGCSYVTRPFSAVSRPLTSTPTTQRRWACSVGECKTKAGVGNRATDVVIMTASYEVLGGCPFHGRVERDEIPTRESPPKQSGTLPCPPLPFPPLPSTPLPSPPLHSIPSAACCCPSQCTPFVRLAS